MRKGAAMFMFDMGMLAAAACFCVGYFGTKWTRR